MSGKVMDRCQNDCRNQKLNSSIIQVLEDLPAANFDTFLMPHMNRTIVNQCSNRTNELGKFPKHKCPVYNGIITPLHT